MRFASIAKSFTVFAQEAFDPRQEWWPVVRQWFTCALPDADQQADAEGDA